MKLTHSILLCTFLASTAVAQAPAPTPAPARVSRPPYQAVMQLASPAWRDGDVIPAKYSQSERDVSPPLTWSGAPEGTVSFVILAHDLDLVSPRGDGLVLSWLVWNIPKSKTSLPEGLPEGANLPDGVRQISDSGPFYRGPAGPHWDPPHHYEFRIYALSSMLDVPALPVPGQSSTAVRAAVEAAMAGKILAKGVLLGTYQRP